MVKHPKDAISVEHPPGEWVVHYRDGTSERFKNGSRRYYEYQVLTLHPEAKNIRILLRPNVVHIAFDTVHPPVLLAMPIAETTMFTDPGP